MRKIKFKSGGKAKRGRSKSFLSEYKKKIKEIEHNKGTKEWLQRFYDIVSESGYFENFLRLYDLSPQEFTYLKIIIREFEVNGICEYVNYGLNVFLTEHGFITEDEGIGWSVKEVKK